MNGYGYDCHDLVLNMYNKLSRLTFVNLKCIGLSCSNHVLFYVLIKNICSVFLIFIKNMYLSRMFFFMHSRWQIFFKYIYIYIYIFYIYQWEFFLSGFIYLSVTNVCPIFLCISEKYSSHIFYINFMVSVIFF